MTDALQHRIIRSLVQHLPLVPRAPLTDRPSLKGVIDELKAARVCPEAFAQAVAALCGESLQ
jgi:hypothetical protein